MLAASPVADRLATSLVEKPATLKAFRLIRQSTGKLVAGIVVAWVLGGFGEEIALRGLLLPWVERRAAPWGGAAAPGMAIGAAAVVAAIAHLYQGLRGYRRKPVSPENSQSGPYPPLVLTTQVHGAGTISFDDS